MAKHEASGEDSIEEPYEKGKGDLSQPSIPTATIKLRRKVKRFLSGALCDKIVNTNNGTFAENCLKACGFSEDPKRSPFESRTELLEFIQAVKEGTTKAPKALISLTVSKLSNAGVEDELQRMAIQVPKSTKTKDKMKFVEEYLLEVHHGEDSHSEIPPTSSSASLRTQNPSKTVNHATNKHIPQLLSEGLSDTTSDEETWSDYQPDVKLECAAMKKSKKGTKTKKRCSAAVSTRHMLLCKGGPSPKKAKKSRKKGDKPTTSNEVRCYKQDEVEKLSTALNMLQAKFVEQVEEHKKTMESLLQAHREEKQRCEKLEMELSSQKHCLDIILDESNSTKSKKPKKVEPTNPQEHKDIKNLKSEIDTLKSSLKVLVEQTVDKHIENVNKRVDKNQHRLEKLRAAHKKQEREPIAACEKRLQSLNFNESDYEVSHATKKATKGCNEFNQELQVREGVQPVAVNIIIKADETCGPNTRHPVIMDQPCSNGKLDVNINLSNHATKDSLPTLKGQPEASRSISRKKQIKTLDKCTDTVETPLEGNSTAGENVNESLKLDRKSYRRFFGNTQRLNDKKEDVKWNKDGVGGVDAQSTNNTTKSYQRRKCLLIHDSTFDGFSQEYFSNQFEVTTFPVKKVSIAAKSQRLKEVIIKKAPECIYVHLGLHDIISSSVDSTLCHFEELRDFFVHSTKANICLSLVVPTTNSPTLNTKIEELNKELSLMISTARNDNALLRDSLFTYDNSSVGWLNEKLDKSVELTKRGKMVMWTKLNDGLRKTLRLPRPSLTKKDSSNTHQNRIHYR
ncbi:hypothetical protein ACHWQZ_G010764 [Mnemiopsis leidyi]